MLTSLIAAIAVGLKCLIPLIRLSRCFLAAPSGAFNCPNARRTQAGDNQTNWPFFSVGARALWRYWPGQKGTVFLITSENKGFEPLI